MSHVRMSRDPWGRVWLDDCPPPPHIVKTAPAHPLARGRPIVDLPPCIPQGGIITDWSGNKCAALEANPNQVALPTLGAPKMEQPTPQVQPSPQVEQPAPQAKPDAATVGQAQSSGAN